MKQLVTYVDALLVRMCGYMNR